MKKLLLALSAVAITASVTSAQTLALYEEFSGENCGPCAKYNPALWKLISANASKVLMLKYQTPIPSAGPIYNAYKTITQARTSYYSISSAPNGVLQGKTPAAHIADLTQAQINTAAAATSPFKITITHTWSSDLDSVTANVALTTPAAFSPSGASLKLRIAIVEHLTYAAAPGTNGEKDFHNVVREMVPDAAGTAIPGTWTAAQTQNYVIKGKVPAMIDKANSDCYLVAWVQNDADKTVYQAAKSTRIALNVLDAGMQINPTQLACVAGTSTSLVAPATLKNTGNAALTSAKIYYKLDGGSYNATPVSWTGSVAPGASTSVAIPALTMTAGTHVVTDSIALPNGSAGELNIANNTRGSRVNVVNTTPVALPITQNFEATGFPAGWITHEPTGYGNSWVNGNGTGAAHNGSSYMPWFNADQLPTAAVGYLIMPTPDVTGGATLEFYQAFVQKAASNNDKLEVVYSTNCGTSWTSLWSQSGAGLATAAIDPEYWLPSPSVGSSDWKLRSVSLNTFPPNAVLAFRATAGGGNNLFLDDVKIRAGAVGINNVIMANSINVYPNPARESATLEFTLAENTKVSVSVLDAVGRTVSVVADGTLSQGSQRINIPTSQLAAGLYNIAIRTEEGVTTQRLSVVK